MAISGYYLVAPLPKGLEGLAELALDLRWSWSHTSDALWQRVDPELWELTRNPWLILQTVASKRLEELARDTAFVAQVADFAAKQHRRQAEPCWFPTQHKDTPLSAAYFSMEFGLSEALPIYSGGLGMLAGDYLKTASDLGVPVTGVGLLYQQGYFRQALDEAGAQVEYYTYNDPSQLPILPVRDDDGEWLRIDLEFPGRCIRLRAWEARVGRVKLYLLDSNDPANSPADQCITAELYGGGPEMRLQQEIVLGIGGWRLLRTLGLDPDICHLNEGHAALAILERVRCFRAHNDVPFGVALTATRAGNIFTTHTPVEAGFDRFAPTLVARYLRHFVEQAGTDLETFMALGRCDPANAAEPLNMAYLAIRGAGAVNGVSRLHGEVSRRIFQGLFPRWPRREVPVTHVTNGVHVPSWDSAAADTLWHKVCGQGLWRGTLEGLSDAIAQVSDEELWQLRNEGCRALVDYAHERLMRQHPSATPCGAGQEHTASFDPHVLTVGFARRFVAYKRPNLLLYDPDRLAALLRAADRPIQLILAGKAHPHDETGKALIQAWSNFIRRPDIAGRVIFLEDYDMSLAEHLVQGVDLWLNTPRRPWEASGTSGMKVLVNGGLNLSELDGWWAEAYRPEVGWALGDGREHDHDMAWEAQEADQLYRLLAEEVIPAFYERDAEGIPRAWVARMRNSVSTLAPQYSSNRMVREYVERLYLPAAATFRARSADDCGPACALCAWRETLAAQWDAVHITEAIAEQHAGQYQFMAAVYTGDLPAHVIRAELYADPLGDGPPEIVAMTPDADAPDGGSTRCYRATLAARRPAGDYTPRLVPCHDAATIPLEAGWIRWQR